MISISSLTYDKAGSLVLDNCKIQIDTAVDPIQKIPTLDGGQVILYGGELYQGTNPIRTQQTVGISGQVTLAQQNRLQEFIDSGDAFLIVSPDGIYTGYFTQFSTQSGNISLSVIIR